MNNDPGDGVGKGIEGREKLAELYPTAKTYDELESDKQRLEEVKKSREEKFPELRVLAEMGGIIGLALLFAYIIPTIVVLSSLSGVSFGFLFGLICIGLAWVHVRRAFYVFQKIQTAYVPFVVTYALSVAPLIAVCYEIFKDEPTGNVRILFIVGSVFVVQAIIGLATILLLKSKKAPDALKVIGLGAIVIISALISFVVL